MTKYENVAKKHFRLLEYMKYVSVCVCVCTWNVCGSRASHTESRKMSLLLMLSNHFTLLRVPLKCVRTSYVYYITFIALLHWQAWRYWHDALCERVDMKLIKRIAICKQNAFYQLFSITEYRYNDKLMDFYCHFHQIAPIS